MRMLMMRGGAQLYSPAGVDDATMMSSSKMNLAQGSEYQEIHANQHGGAAFDLNSSAPVGDTGVLDQSLRVSAHLAPLDASLSSIRGMSDQSGGARRKKSSKFGKAVTRRAVAAIKKLKNMFKKMAKRGRAMLTRKKQRGGSKMCGGKMMGGNRMYGGQMNAAPKMMGGSKMYGGQMNAPPKMMGGSKMYGGQMNAAPKMMGGNRMYGGQMNAAPKMMGGSKMYGGQMNAAPKMMGGARRKGSKSATRRAVAAIKKLKNMFKKMAKRGRAMFSRKKQRGGSASSLSAAADYSSPGMLLSPAMENRALLGMHTQEWKLAADPTSFAPKMA
jgi:hypothetical protein